MTKFISIYSDKQSSYHRHKTIATDYRQITIKIHVSVTLLYITMLNYKKEKKSMKLAGKFCTVSFYQIGSTVMIFMSDFYQIGSSFDNVVDS